MTREQAIKLLGNEATSQAVTSGKEWGALEVELYRDQNEDKELPAWTMGTYAGTLPPLTEDEAEAYELIMDCAARDVWNLE